MLNALRASRLPSRVFPGGLTALSILLFSCNLTLANTQGQGKGEKEGMEEFEEEDPYTKGKDELVKKLGYVRLGHGPWRPGEDTRTLQMNLGGIDMLFAETEHFCIASTLGTYKIPNNRDERSKLKDEIKRLKKKLGRLKEPKKKLDPWLRLHIFAQRAEDHYAEFCEDFSLTESDFKKSGPHMGYPNKIVLVVCQRKSEFGRYVRNYHNSDIEYAYRTVMRNDALFVAINIEAIKEGREMETELPFDTMLHNMLASNLTTTFMDGYQDNMFSAPRWFVYGMSHRNLRRIDPHWTLFDGRKENQGSKWDAWKWSPRVYNLVDNGFYASANDMFTWKKYEDLHQRDHMVSWSKTEFLMDELEGDKRAFLSAICNASGGFSTNQNDDELVNRQKKALKDHFGLTPEEFDKAWCKWVKKTYRKR